MKVFFKKVVECVLVPLICFGCSTAQPRTLQDIAIEGLSPRATLMRILKMNRTGHWTRAAQLSHRLLAVPELLPGDRCQALYSAAYAYFRLGDAEGGRDFLARFEEQCGRGQLRVDGALYGEIQELRFLYARSLPPPDEAPAAQAQPE